MFAGTLTAEKDSTFMAVQFYAAVAAIQLRESPTAIAALERAKNTDYRLNDIYQYLCHEYQQIKDTVNYEKTLKEGFDKFPNEDYFLLNLINKYIDSGKKEKALEYLNIAIAKNPNKAQLYYVSGLVYETGMKDYANAEIYFKKALEKEPNLTDALSSLGRLYYNQAVEQQTKANRINDSKKYQEKLNIAKELFRKALPYFKKAHEAEPTKRDNMIGLRGIYYNLNMVPELEAIEIEMNKL